MKMQILILILFVVFSNVESFDQDGLYARVENMEARANTFDAFFKRIRGDQCSTHSDCQAAQYCFFPRKITIGNCVQKKRDDIECSEGENFSCLSNFCYRKVCRQRHFHMNLKKNGNCQSDSYCHRDQYCNSGQCIDRQILGWCTFALQCLSKECKFYRCYPLLPL
jgi:hypothetical protein